MPTYDGAVIGAGHNGLTLAAYLSRAGLRIAVLERNAAIGGGTGTDEPTLPGYRFNLHANFFMGLRHAPLMRDLELYRFGFSFVEPPVQQAAAFRDGSCVVVHQDVAATCASLARFSRRDAATFRELYQLYGVRMRPLLVSLLYNAPLPVDQLRDRLSGPEARGLLAHARHDLFGVVREHFDDDRIRTLFTAYMHVITAENEPGAGIVFPAVLANVMGFTLPVGGAATLPRALARIVEAAGGAVITGAEVREIRIGSGRATGVRLANGETVEAARFVASAVDAPATLRMAGETLFPADVREKLAAWHWGHHSLVTLHLALRDRPLYRARAFDRDIDRAFNIFFGMDDIDQVAQCFDHCAAGRFPDVLMGNGACNSDVDPTYAPPGGHSAFWWPFAPYAVDGDAENWDRHRTRTPAACSKCGANTPSTSTTRTCGRRSSSPRSTSSGTTSTCIAARSAWAPSSPRSSASTGRTRSCRGRGRRSRGCICADPRAATAAGSTARPATSRRTRSPRTSTSIALGHRCHRRNGGTDVRSRGISLGARRSRQHA